MFDLVSILNIRRGLGRGDRIATCTARSRAGPEAQLRVCLFDVPAAEYPTLLARERRLIEQAQQEKEEFDRILRVQREAEEVEHHGKTKKLMAAHEHMEELQAQILMNAEVRKKNRMDFLDEGVQQRARMEAGRLKLEGIKSEKLKSLQGAGVPAKYTVDLANKKFT